MEVKVINVIRMPREITNGKYNLYKIMIDKDIDAVVDGKLTKRNGFGLTEFAVRYYGIEINSIIGKTIDIDVTYHKAGDTFVNLWGDKDKFKKDCIEVRINKVMILAILVAYKAFNDKSLTVVTDEYVVNFAVIDTINNDTVSLLSYANNDNYGKITIKIDDITGIQFQK